MSAVSICNDSSLGFPIDSLSIMADVGACLGIFRGRDRGRFPLNRGGADVVGSRPNEEATTMSEGKSARVRWVGRDLYRALRLSQARFAGSGSGGVCGVARLVRGARHGRRRTPCIRSLSLSLSTRLTWITQTGS